MPSHPILIGTINREPRLPTQKTQKTQNGHPLYTGISPASSEMQ